MCDSTISGPPRNRSLAERRSYGQYFVHSRHGGQRHTSHADSMLKFGYDWLIRL